jgi:hypothetical protein
MLTTKAGIWKHNKQYVCLLKRCTMDAIIQVIEDYDHAKDFRLDILAIFFDLAKVFDLVGHEVLLTKLGRFLPRSLISWIAAYLSNRRQKMVMGNTVTEWKRVEAGFIQGSVFGPVLFVLFIFDINKAFSSTLDWVRTLVSVTIDVDSVLERFAPLLYSGFGEGFHLIEQQCLLLAVEMALVFGTQNLQSFATF